MRIPSIQAYRRDADYRRGFENGVAEMAAAAAAGHDAKALQAFSLRVRLWRGLADCLGRTDLAAGYPIPTLRNEVPQTSKSGGRK